MKTATPNLTRREREVGQLIAQGLTSRQIASKLFIAERTAEYHVEQIRNKLGFHSRSQIAAWVTEQEGNGEHAMAVRQARPRTWPPARWFALTIAAVVATSTAAWIIFHSNQSTAPLVLTGNTVVRIDPSGRLNTFPMTSQASQLTVGEGAIWVISYSDQSLSRLESESGAVVEVRGIPNAPPTGIAVGAGSIWIATAFGEESLQRFDPKAHRFEKPINLGSGLQGIAYGRGSIWVVNKNDDAVYRIDPETNAIVSRITVGRGPEAIAVSRDAVWVTNSLDRSLSRIDPVSDSVDETIPLRVAPTSIAASREAIWVASAAEDAVIRIDPVTNAETDVALPISPSGIATNAAGVWGYDATSHQIARIDPATNQVGKIRRVDGIPLGIAADNSGVWVALTRG